MAFLDDKTWLLSFIRNQFIITDNTSMCENIIGSELSYEESENSHSGSSQPSSREDGESSSLSRPRGASSPDITLNMDTRMSRRRSNTTVRLENIRKERDEKSKIKTTNWKSARNIRGFSSQPDQETPEAFMEKVIVPMADTKRQSALTKAVQKRESGLKQTLFLEYAKFDARMLRGAAVKTFKVFFHLQTFNIQPPMMVVVPPSSRFLDLIGLVCWQYGEEHRDPPLKDSIDFYHLFMAEDNGAIDEDLPQVDMVEQVARFGESNLAFVESESPTPRAVAAPVVVKINLVEGSFSKVVLGSSDVTLRSILEKVLKKRKMQSTVKGLDYTLEKMNEPGVKVDLDQTLENVKVNEFWLIRANSKNPVSVRSNSTGEA